MEFGKNSPPVNQSGLVKDEPYLHLHHFTGKPPGIIEIDSGVVPRPLSGRSYDKPWRKSAGAVRAEREKTQLLLGPDSGGVNTGAVRHVLAVRELLDKEPGSQSGKHLRIQEAATSLLQAATNARERTEVEAARLALQDAIERAGLAGTLAKWQHRHADGGSAALKKLQLMHEETHAT